MNEIRAVSGKHELVAKAETLAMLETIFTLGEVDRVAYWVQGMKINGSYMGTDFTIQLSQGDKRRAFFLKSGHRDGNLEYARDSWSQLVDLLESTVCPRLAADVIHTVEAGETAKLGMVAVSSEGVRRRQKLSAKTVRWAEVTGTEVGARDVKVLGRDAKVLVAAGASEFNAVLLPRVVKHFAA